jgi:hypothetical protein
MRDHGIVVTTRWKNTKTVGASWLFRVGVIVLIFLAPLAGMSQKPDSGNRSNEQQQPLALSCSSYCSTTESRVSLSDVHFGGVQVDPANARLEFTVYSEGFERGAFASFSPLIADPETSPQLSLTALRGLRPFVIRLVAVEPAPQGPSILGVTLKGLEPSVNYTWRLLYETEDDSSMSAVASCPTPVCIHDAQ